MSGKLPDSTIGSGQVGSSSAPATPATPARNVPPVTPPTTFPKSDPAASGGVWNVVKQNLVSANSPGSNLDVARQAVLVLAMLPGNVLASGPSPAQSLATDSLHKASEAKGLAKDDQVAFTETYLHHASDGMRGLARDLLNSASPKSGEAVKAWTSIVAAGRLSPAMMPRLTKEVTDRVLRGEITADQAGALAEKSVHE